MVIEKGISDFNLIIIGGWPVALITTLWSWPLSQSPECIHQVKSIRKAAIILYESGR
jgi:hypothetical protein